MKYIKYTYRVKDNNDFRFNEEGDLLEEVNVIAHNKNKALEILEKNYPYFKQEHVYLKQKVELNELFKR